MATSITTWTALNNMRNNLSEDYTLNRTLQSSDGDYISNWSPVGSSGSPFIGKFNGNGYEIQSLNINRSGTPNCGLFGYCSGATIKNVKIINADYHVGSESGGIIGYNINGNATDFMSGCSFTGTIHASDYSYCIGGLIGKNESNSVDQTMSNSHASVSIIIDYSVYNVGGLIGYNYIEDRKFSLTNCYANGYNSGNIITGNTGVYQVGGLIGYNEIRTTPQLEQAINFTMIDCYAGGNIEIENTNYQGSIGGLIGFNQIVDYEDFNINEVRIEDCYFDGNIKINVYDTNNSKVGGFIGYNYINFETGTSGSSGSSGQSTEGSLVYVNNCYSKGMLSGKLYSEVGGFIGYNFINFDSGNIFFDKCYSSMDVDATSILEYVGGFIGYNSCRILTVRTDPYVTTQFRLRKNNGEDVKVYLTGMQNEDFYSVSHIGGLIGYNDLLNIDFFVYKYSADVFISSGDYSAFIGGLIGESFNTLSDVSLDRCYSNVSIISGDSSHSIGGLIGYIETSGSSLSLTNSYSRAYNPYDSNNIIELGSYSYKSGCLIGYINIRGKENNYENINFTMNSCNAEGDIEVKDVYSDGGIGGAVGYIDINNSYSTDTCNVNINKCYSKTKINILQVSTYNIRIGGFIGYSYYANSYGGDFKIDECFSVGSIGSAYKAYNAGGFIGYINVYSLSGTQLIQNCFSIVDVSSTNLAGGFIGEQQSLYPSYKYCYASGEITSSDASRDAGFVSYLADPGTSFTSCFWDTDRGGAYGIAPTGSATGLEGRTSLQMKTQSTFDPPWLFATIWAMSSGSSEFLGYPYFKYFIPTCSAYVFYISSIGKVLYIGSGAGEISATICN